MAYRKGTYCKCTRCEKQGWTIEGQSSWCVVQIGTDLDWIKHNEYKVIHLKPWYNRCWKDRIDKKYLKKLSKIELIMYGIEECI